MLDAPRLSSFPFFSELSPAGQARLHAATSHVLLAPQTKVIQRGDEVGGVYLVEAGALRVYYVSAEGREGTLYWVDAGQSCVLALNCLFSRLAYPAWVETDQVETRVAIISGDVYRQLYLGEPALQKFTFETLTTRLFELMTLMQETASLGLEQRVAALLLRRSVNGQALEITHEQIAHHLGSSREVVSRVLRNLAARGAIKLSHRSIAIEDSTKLRAIVEPFLNP
jgi:CRP/FNR family transcriptional regulator, anaerobic regulatory protein